MIHLLKNINKKDIWHGSNHKNCMKNNFEKINYYLKYIYIYIYIYIETF